MDPSQSELASGLRHNLGRQALAAQVSAAVLAVFDSYHAQFKLVARRAQARFEHRDWRGGQLDAVERLRLYRQFVEWTVGDVQRLLGGVTEDRELWSEVKRAYTRQAVDRFDAELAFTFFNSISRRLLRTVGVDAEVEYVSADFDRLPLAGLDQPIHRTYPDSSLLDDLCRRILRDLPFAGQFRDLAGDAALVAAAISADLSRLRGRPAVESVELIPALFYRNKGAYLVGRMRAGELTIPLVMPLVNTEEGVAVDAVLTTSDDVSIVFSFTRSYFHVEIERPRAMIEFLRTIMPLKPIDELYTSLGYHKHGKTELYRALLRHLEASDARFELAEGDRGLVMSVFALPSLNVVFKIIKDRFGPPKNTTRQAVMDKYQLVFVRDRVGRLADAQEFEGLEFRRDRFDPALLQELLAEAGHSVRVEGERVIVRHLYTERRVTPLNLFLKQAPEPAALEAVLDYGQAIKDLAVANIFTGDMLLKNFGVTRHGRVIFYDYDELCLLTECNFRELPAPTTEEDEYAAEPWFYVGERDVFPGEFKAFLLLPGRLGEEFLRSHGDLLEVDFWRRMQESQAAGEVVDFFPYKQARRLRGAG